MHDGAAVPGPALLFCPADRPERFSKAASCADAVILDLEDGVAPEDSSAARAAVASSSLNPETTFVRINPAGTAEFDLDFDALAHTPYRRVMLAKSESAAQLDALQNAGCDVIALCETAAGVENAAEIARHPAVVALMWGAEDLVAGMGGRSSRSADGTYRDAARYARSRVLIAARSEGKAAVDAVHLDIADVEGLREEASDAAAVGFSATACIHPSQVAVIRASYAPSPGEREWAIAVLDEAETQPGVFRFGGRMIDEPVLRQARAVLRAVPTKPEEEG
ncbi:HpcH/HpaI aldolase/citrate lyase family protein [Microbacterium halotolerans]|uniref:HpcH/HpaI aldolase/citrate lyase family protein n=1 Tax=Microbacterium halotolerans TaxID=246613 RepID=UPI000E6ACDF8|nr:CoA ester lyase [Microbacterium halotolerans]